MYQPYEIEISQKQVRDVISKLREPICLLGGWAVYLTLTENFKRENGRDYLGSRDIDLGFHIEKDWSGYELENSTIATAINTLNEMNFESLSFRFFKQFHKDTKQELTGEELRKTPSYDIFYLFVDPIVDHIHSGIREIFGFVPIDEPLLEHVFLGKKYRTIDLSGRKILLPLPHILLATKIKSVTRRDKEHKRIKDIADIYGLSWYSDENITKLKTNLTAIIPHQNTRTIIESFTRNDLDAVSNILGIETQRVQRVLNELKY
jgi:hypothetical protein